MSRMYLFVLSGGLAVAAAVCLYFGITLLPNIGSYVTDNYHQYAGSGDTARYACTGSPNDVASSGYWVIQYFQSSASWERSMSAAR